MEAPAAVDGPPSAAESASSVEPSVAEIAAAAVETCFIDIQGRVLSVSDGAGGTVACTDGVVTEQGIFKLLRVGAEDASLYVLALRDGGFVGNIGPTSPTSSPGAGAGAAAVPDGAVTLAAVEFMDEAQRFSLVVNNEVEVSFRLEGRSPAVHLFLTVCDDGSVSTSADPYAFTMLTRPVMGTITAAYALRRMHGKRIALWGGPELGWVSPAPVRVFGGGEVKSRVPRLGEWECIDLQVLDAATGKVALRSVHERYLCALQDGSLVADKKAVGQWEQFELVQCDPATVALCSRAHNGGRVVYVSAEHERMDVKASAIGAPQRFVLFDAAEARKRYYDTNPAFKVPAKEAKLSPLAIAGIVAGGLAAVAAVAGGIAAAVLSAQEAERKEREAVEQRDREVAAAAEAARVAAEAQAAAAAELERLRQESEARERDIARLQRAFEAAAVEAARKAEEQRLKQREEARQAAARARAQAEQAARELERVRRVNEARVAAAAKAAAEARAAEAAAEQRRAAEKARHDAEVQQLASRVATLQVNQYNSSVSYASSYSTTYVTPSRSYTPAYTPPAASVAYCGKRTKQGTSCRNLRGKCRWH